MQNPLPVRKKLLPILFTTVAAAAALFPTLKAGSKVAEVKNYTVATAPAAPAALDLKATAAAASTALYDSLHLDQLGLSPEAMQYAYLGFLQLKDKGALRNEDVLSIVDFSQSSFKKRLYIIDVANFKVLRNTYVAHGKNSGLQYASNFSNTPESLQSSLGFYVTKGTYFGKHGLSLRLDGKESGINCQAEARAIVVHGAEYIGTHRLGAPYMGRSFGCPAVPQAEASEVINTIKDGTCMFIYHPSKKYLQSSKLLNS
ncbi:hypothetical protein BUE76_02060 [Cnuella takakiae]|nr:hypothetical protein BUE76_02060 [Cnuella takakiae]